MLRTICISITFVGFIIGVVPPDLLSLFEGDFQQMLLVIVAYIVLNSLLTSLIPPYFVGDAGLSSSSTRPRAQRAASSAFPVAASADAVSRDAMAQSSDDDLCGSGNADDAILSSTECGLCELLRRSDPDRIGARFLECM